MKILVAVPVFNEQRYVRRVLHAVREYADHVLVIDDGSSDQTPQILEELAGPLSLDVIEHPTNIGYGRSLRDAFARAAERGFDWVITMDCDEQHEPATIPRFVRAAADSGLDIVSGSRYLTIDANGDQPPPDRRAINHEITAELNERLGMSLTDAFCGFKAHRVEALSRITLSEDGYALPMQFWVQCVAAGLAIGEIPVELIYNDQTRTFGGGLDDSDIRRAHYRRVLHCELERCADRLPAEALIDVAAGCRGR